MATRRLRYNLCSSSISTLLGGAETDTTISLNGPLTEGGPTGTNIPTLLANDILALRIDNEIVHLTSYTSGATTGTILRAQEGTLIASHAQGADVRNVATKADLDVSLLDNIYTPDPSAPTLEGTDEFDDDSIDLDWVRIDQSGTAANVQYTEARGVLSIKHEGYDPSSYWHGFVRPIPGTLTAPFTIETCLRASGNYAANHHMLGLVMSDGVAWGAGKQVFCHGYSNSSNGSGLLNTQYYSTNWNANTTFGSGYGQAQAPGGRFYYRLQYAGADTWNCWWSGDGVSWIQTLTNGTYAMTPTHFGFGFSHWNGTLKTISTFEYFRVY